MIYSETIEQEPLWASFTRQKNERGTWYGLVFEYKDRYGTERYCDNPAWIDQTLLPLVTDRNWYYLRQELQVDWSKKDFKRLAKLASKAYYLGWFVGIDRY